MKSNIEKMLLGLGFEMSDLNRDTGEFSGGWHLGFGTETQVYGNVHFRTDFRMGFSPGRQLIVSVGLVYRFK